MKEWQKKAAKAALPAGIALGKWYYNNRIQERKRKAEIRKVLMEEGVIPQPKYEMRCIRCKKHFTSSGRASRCPKCGSHLLIGKVKK